MKDKLLTTHLYVEDWGPGALLREDGKMCCLGQDCLDRGAPRTRLRDRNGYPRAYPWEVGVSGWGVQVPDLYKEAEALLGLTPDGPSVGRVAAEVNDWCFEAQFSESPELDEDRAAKAFPLLHKIFRAAGRRLVVHKTGKRKLA